MMVLIRITSISGYDTLVFLRTICVFELSGRLSIGVLRQ